MKKYIGIFIVLILLLTSCSTISSLVPKALASDTQEIVEQVETSSTDTFAEIQKNIDLVTALKIKAQQSQVKGEKLSLDDVIEDLQKVTISFEKLSGQHEAIKRGLLKKIATIEEMQSRISDEITTLQARRADYLKQLQSVNDPNPEITKVRKEALTQAIKYVDSQIKLWVEFNGIEDNIVSEMSNVSKTIDSFLNAIDSSALLFREGLNLLILQRDISNSLSLFTQDLPRMNQLSIDMQKSWANLDYLVENLTSIGTVSLK